MPVEALDVHHFETDCLIADLASLEALRFCHPVRQHIDRDMIQCGENLLDGMRNSVSLIGAVYPNGKPALSALDKELKAALGGRFVSLSEIGANSLEPE